MNEKKVHDAVMEAKEMTVCEPDGSLEADRCMREEQCDSCYFKDHPEDVLHPEDPS